MRKAYVPEEICSLVASYYSNVSIRFTTRQFTTAFQQVEKGIITGCTLSVALFALAMCMLVLSVRKTTKGPVSVSGQQQENSRLFMDDINTSTIKVLQSNYLLKDLGAALDWGRMSVKPEKCRSLILLKGVISKRTLQINNNPMTRLQDKPIKYLGKQYNATLTDQQQIEKTIQDTRNSLKTIDKDRLPGRYKAWILQHMLLHQTMWPLLIYAFPASKVEEIQRMFTRYIKKWLGFPRSMSVDVLYSKSCKLQLPFSDIAEEAKVAKVRTQVTFEQSEDKCVSNAGISLEAGKKWRIATELDQAKSRLRMQDIAGTANRGREGLGLRHIPIYSGSKGKERRNLITGKTREKIEEERQVRITNLRQQGAITKWEVEARRISAQQLLRSSENALRFLVRAVYDLLPTPANKNKWFNTEDNRCKVCGGDGTLAHVLSGCKVALAQGRYRWRHNKVLAALADEIEKKRLDSNAKKPMPTRTHIQFVKAGQKRRGEPKTLQHTSYLDQAQDWQMKVDLDKQLKIPPDIVSTSLRPDMIIFSREAKQLGVIELTVPIEERVTVSNELKRSKYQCLKENTKWNVRIWAVEVGCRGFLSSSMSTLFKQLGIRGKDRQRGFKKVCSAAEEASSVLWKMSHVERWGAKNQQSAQSSTK